jgi:sterol desaturase/sphingolipid hydroxylase (fatty acid hydroxylase superfamily)
MEILHNIFDWIGIPILAGVFFCLFIIEEKFQLRKRVQSKWKRSIINNIISIPSFLLLRFMFLPIMIWLTIQNEQLKFGLNYLYELPAWAEAAIAFLIFDYTNYLWHTLNHKLPMLWRFHIVHHSDLDLDLSTATRFHFGELIGSVFFRGAFVFLSGASPLIVIIYEIVFEAATLFHHSNTRVPIKIENALNKVIVTPRMHGIHHSIYQNEADSNYSVIFSFWDRLHRTFNFSVPQDEIIIGVPAYHDKEELSAQFLLKLPFTRIRKWKESHLERKIGKTEN